MKITFKNLLTLNESKSEEKQEPETKKKVTIDGGTVEEIIKKIGKGKWRIYSKKSHKNLGTFGSQAAAKKHESEIEYFKHKG